MWLFLTLFSVAVLTLAIWWRWRKSSHPAARPAGRRPAGKRPPGRPTGTKKAPAPAGGPQPGEIWWADVPYEDGPGSKVRPCVVLRVKGGAFEILKITSQDQSHRRDHIEIATKSWDADADHNSYLDLSDPITVTTAAFANRAGALDTPTWRKVKALHQA
ncbi:type II toxin-antitoxin system PemK/MazF family toxin [Catellatospora sichuanensis]|uniref:type II toxin-antitoxin system PemK/MazF family toxin n=1 Tax=Catellatospora sichuanensis TaxID=1969805 RepID=UPI0011834640|nr:type II toxin-antitoxin system PemK/MazF family toxin [Catellatospora sichuanensis]